MAEMKKLKFNLLISASGFSLSAITVCFISILKTLPYESRQTTSYFIAAVFWVTLIVGIVFLKFTDKLRKKCESNFDGADKKNNRSKCGAISFRQNREAKIADAVFIVLFILLIIVSFIRLKSNSAGIVLTGLMFLSFDIHSFLNGKNYQCYKILKGRGIKNDMFKE